MAVERAPGGTSLIDVLDRILDKGIVVDAWVRISASPRRSRGRHDQNCQTTTMMTNHRQPQPWLLFRDDVCLTSVYANGSGFKRGFRVGGGNTQTLEAMCA